MPGYPLYLLLTSDMISRLDSQITSLLRSLMKRPTAVVWELHCLCTMSVLSPSTYNRFESMVYPVTSILHQTHLDQRNH